MAFPVDVVTREVTFGPAFDLASGDGLSMRVTFTPSRSMVRGAPTGAPGIAVEYVVTAEEGMQGSVMLPVTDQSGWFDGNGNALSVADGAQTHAYRVLIQTLKGGRTVGGAIPAKTIVLPMGDLSPVDLDGLIPVTSTSGVTVAIPDEWYSLVATAEEAAAAAAAALIDSDAFVAEKVADPESLTGAALSATIGTAVESKEWLPALGRFFGALPSRATAPVRIAFCGSSSVAGWGSSEPSKQFVDVLVRYIQAAYPAPGGSEAPTIENEDADFGALSTTPGVHGYNAGKGGDTSANYLTPTKAAKVAALQPALVYHMVGSNDSVSGVTPATYKANVAAAIALIDSGTTAPPVHVLVHQFKRNGVDASLWAQYAQALRDLAGEAPASRVFIDISGYFAANDAPGSDPLDLISTDNVHMTDAGHALLADMLRRALGITIPTPAAAGAAPVQVSPARWSSDAFAVDGAVEGRSTDVALGGATKPYVQAGGGFEVAGARLAANAVAATAFAGLAVPALDMQMSFTVGVLPTDRFTAALYRATAAATGTPDFYGILFGTFNGSTAALQKRVGGTTTTFGTTALALGDRLAIRYFRGVLYLLKNGVVVASQADTSVARGGFAGFVRTSGVNAGAIDDLALDVLA